MVARQAVENWHIPFDQVVGFLNDREFLHENQGDAIKPEILSQILKKLTLKKNDLEAKKNLSATRKKGKRAKRAKR